MKQLKQLALVAACGLSAMLALSSPVAEAAYKIQLTIANGIAPTVPTNWWFQDFIGPKLKEDSQGQIEPNVQVNGTLCSEHKCVEQAKLGQIALSDDDPSIVGQPDQSRFASQSCRGLCRDKAWDLPSALPGSRRIQRRI